MGCFNTVGISCPHCKSKNELQSKEGSCSFRDTSIYEAEPEDKVCAAGIRKCDKCGELFFVRVIVHVFIERESKEIEDAKSESEEAG